MKEKKELFSKTIRAGKRIYFFDVRESKERDKYLIITESTKTEKDKYRHSRIIVFSEHLPAFVKAMEEVIKFMEGS